MTTIFPNFIKEVENFILDYTPTMDLYALSAVNQAANQVISNQFFEKRFKEEHPAVTSYTNIFSHLCTFHPEKCWKVVCSVLRPNCEKYTSVKGFEDLGFIEQSVPNMIQHRLAQKLEYQKMLKSICGSYDGDPSSPIYCLNQAWVHAEEASKKNMREREEEKQEFISIMETLPQEEKVAIKNSWSQLTQDITQAIVNSPFRGILERGLEVGEEILPAPPTKEEFKEMYFKDVQLNAMEERQFSMIFRCVFESKFHSESEGFRNQYERLDRQRISFVSSLTSIETFQDLLISQDPEARLTCLNIHNTLLIEELNIFLKLESRLKTLLMLQECLDLIKNVIENPLEDCVNVKTYNIYKLINLLPDYERVFLWNTLQFHYDNDDKSSDWAEKHFAEHLPKLEYLIVGLISIAKKNTIDFASQKVTYPSI